MNTEEEAKKLWCPFAKAVTVSKDGGETKSHNRFSLLRDHGEWAMNLNPEECRCIASQCAAWRWGGPAETRYADLAETQPIDGPRPGYCGLAGKP